MKVCLVYEGQWIGKLFQFKVMHCLNFSGMIFALVFIFNLELRIHQKKKEKKLCVKGFGGSGLVIEKKGLEDV